MRPRELPDGDRGGPVGAAAADVEAVGEAAVPAAAVEAHAGGHRARGVHSGAVCSGRVAAYSAPCFRSGVANIKCVSGSLREPDRKSKFYRLGGKRC